KVVGGDSLEVIDHYGRQPAELTVLASDPRAVAGVRPDTAATVLRRLVPGPDENGYAAARIVSLLAEHRIDQHASVATRLFDEHS
ncbi:aminomethyltransferase, partial [Mycobacterium sp. ITM-2017-0098]